MYQLRKRASIKRKRKGRGKKRVKRQKKQKGGAFGAGMAAGFALPLLLKSTTDILHAV